MKVFGTNYIERYRQLARTIQATIEQPEMSDVFMVKWDSFRSSLVDSVRILREEGTFSDVSLLCSDGRRLGAHRVLLASSSPFFRDVLQSIEHPHPVIYLRGVMSEDMLPVLDFIYSGEVSLPQGRLESFLALGEDLKVEGLIARDHCPVPAPTKPPGAPPLPDSGADQPSGGEEAASIKMELVVGEEAEGDRATGAEVEVDVDSSQGGEVWQGNQDPEGTVKRRLDWLAQYLEVGEEFLHCTVCGKTSKNKNRSTKNNMMDHVERMHFPGTFQFTCHLCAKTFDTKSRFYDHKTKAHKKKPDKKKPASIMKETADIP